MTWPPLPDPYYCDDAVCIYNADCRELLPLLPRVDLVLTDPPYGMDYNVDNSRFSGNSGHGSGPKRFLGGRDKTIKPITGDNQNFDPSFLFKFDNLILWGFNHFPQHLKQGTALVWIKRNEDAFGKFLSDAEIAWMNKGKGVYCFKDLSMNAIANERSHPTQKPESLMNWCLSFYPDAQTILDPFAGSCTTGRAAKDLGRKCICIEIEERYCEIGARRMAQEVLAL